MHSGATSESVPTSVPVNKTIVPCFFYFNGFCNKGDRCSFLHDINAEAPQGEKLVKTTLENSEVPNQENNTIAVRESGSAAPANKPFIQQQTSKLIIPFATAKAEADTRVQPKVEFQISMPEDVTQKSGSSPISVSEGEETATINSDSPPAEGFVHRISYACEEDSSEEEVDDQIDPEERWESSPGFDVVVDDERENVDSEDDPEYVMAHDRERKDLNSHFRGYDYENQVEYDSRHAGMELQYERETYRRYNHPVSEDNFGDASNISVSRKRRLIPMELAFDNHSYADLRDHLRRRRFNDSHSFTSLSRMRESSQQIGRIHGDPWQQGMDSMQPHESFTSDVGRSGIESLNNNRAYSNGGRRHGFPRHAHKRQSRRPYKEKQFPKRRFPSSEVSSTTVPRERRYPQGFSTFSGPKTLAQIKEEKQKPENSCYSRKSSVDFQGPKPLSEILKDKGKLLC